MSTFVDYKINLIDKQFHENIWRCACDDIVAVGIGLPVQSDYSKICCGGFASNI